MPEPLLAIADVVGLLRAGSSPADAWMEAGASVIEPDGAPVLGERDAITNAIRAACRLAHHSGAPLADVLDVVALHARGEREAQAARDAAIAGPRLSSIVLSWLPGVGLGLAVLVDTRAWHVLVATPLGWGLLLTAGLLSWAGRTWMLALVRDAARAGSDAEPSAGEIPGTLMVALMDAAIAAGLDIRSAIAAVGAAVNSDDGGALDHVASRLALGDSWESAWEGAPERLSPLQRSLRTAWKSGTAPRAMLAATAHGLALQSRVAADKAVGELSVRMSLPLALCQLPAFALVGVIPMVVAVASSAMVTMP